MKVLSWMAFNLCYLRLHIKRKLSLFSFCIAVTNQVVCKAKLPVLESGIMLLKFMYLVAELEWTCCTVKLEISARMESPSQSKAMLWRQKYLLWSNKASYSPLLILLHFHACVEVSSEVFECCQADASAEALKLQWMMNDAVNFSQLAGQTLCLWIMPWGWGNLGLLLVQDRCEQFLCVS